jgi:hypothetical protein
MHSSEPPAAPESFTLFDRVGAAKNTPIVPHEQAARRDFADVISQS